MGVIFLSLIWIYNSRFILFITIVVCIIKTLKIKLLHTYPDRPHYIPNNLPSKCINKKCNRVKKLSVSLWKIVQWSFLMIYFANFTSFYVAVDLTMTVLNQGNQCISFHHKWERMWFWMSGRFINLHQTVVHLDLLVE